MGKSETARMFEALGIPVFDSDSEVHRLYAKGGALVRPISIRFPDSLVDGAIDRARLSVHVLNDSQALTELEAIVHPMVRHLQEEFLSGHSKAGKPIAVLDIPLLFEAGREEDVDVVVVVSAPAGVQRERALARPGMTESKLAFILAKQWPDDRKRAAADYVVDTSQGLEHARRQVREIVDELLARNCEVRNA